MGSARESDALTRDKDAARQEARRALLADIPGETAARLGGLGRRSPPDEVRAVLLELLRKREWQLEELATLLQRNPEYIRQKFVQPLLQAGTISMTRSEEPNSPKQAYKATPGDQ